MGLSQQNFTIEISMRLPLLERMECIAIADIQKKCILLQTFVEIWHEEILQLMQLHITKKELSTRFFGAADIENQIIRCVGEPRARFEEDALRILRALRFSSVYQFVISDSTSNAIHDHKDKLLQISAERIQSELCKIIFGRNSLDILTNYKDVISEIIPELRPCIGFEQNNPYHEYDVYDHIVHAVSNYSGDDISVKIALLLHDVGKPCCYTQDERGGHFYGHAAQSVELAETVLKRLRFDNGTRCEVLELIQYHDATIEPTRKTIRRWLNKVGERTLWRLLDIQLADICAHAKNTQGARVDRNKELRALLDSMLSEDICFKVKDLAVTGDDVKNAGIPEGPMVGEVLQYILSQVIEEKINNERKEELDIVRAYMAEYMDEQ